MSVFSEQHLQGEHHEGRQHQQGHRDPERPVPYGGSYMICEPRQPDMSGFGGGIRTYIMLRLRKDTPSIMAQLGMALKT